MKTRIMTDEATTRRAFLGGAAALAACAIVPGRVLGGESPRMAAAAPGKPNSVFNGVRIGCITYSYRGGIIRRRIRSRPLFRMGSAKWN